MKRWQFWTGLAAGAGLTYLAQRLAGGSGREPLASDDRIAERVRAAIARFVPGPHAVTVDVQDGTVTLGGRVLADDAGPLLSAVCRVRGVDRVVDRLEVHAEPTGIPELQLR
jgi:osmotically-inducible protein OsmY